MPADVTRLELRLRRRSMTGYAAGMALYTLVVVALYPSFKDSTSLDSLSGSTAAALLGVTGQLTSPGGWLNGNIYGNFFPLIMLLLTIGYGAACLAGQDEDGTLALIATLPAARRAILLQKLAAMALQALLLAAAVTACVLIGRGFQLTVSPANAVATSIAVVLMGLDFGLVALTAGAATGRRGTALGIASALAAASYLLSALAPAIPAIRPARYLSLFYWSAGNNQIGQGVSAADYAVLITAGLCALAAAVNHRVQPGRPQLGQRRRQEGPSPG